MINPPELIFMGNNVYSTVYEVGRIGLQFKCLCAMTAVVNGKYMMLYRNLCLRLWYCIKYSINKILSIGHRVLDTSLC